MHPRIRRRPSLSINISAPSTAAPQIMHGPVDEGGVCLSLPPHGWLQFCMTCTRPTSQRAMLITQCRGGEMYTVVLCRKCQAGVFQRSSPHFTFLVMRNHLRQPIRDVNAEADEAIALYKLEQAQRAAALEETVLARRKDRMLRKAQSERTGRKKRCTLQ